MVYNELAVPGELAVDDEVGVEHAQALHHLVGPEVVVDDDEFGDERVQKDCLKFRI